MDKGAREIAYLAKAAKITSGIFRVVTKQVKPGAREIEIARSIDSIIKKKGLKRSFRTIVASGQNAAKPHAKVTGRKIGQKDAVVVDFGVIYRGYHSDMTRTIMVGKANPVMRRFYDTIKTAQKMAIKKIRPGIKISDFVRSVHDYIRKRGLGRYIAHSLGHGIGTRVHEGPKLSEKNKRILKERAVVTIEPGLYMKKIGGARIEDMVLVGKNGVRVLTK